VPEGLSWAVQRWVFVLFFGGTSAHVLGTDGRASEEPFGKTNFQACGEDCFAQTTRSDIEAEMRCGGITLRIGGS